MCQTIIVNETHKLQTPSDLMIMIPNAEAVLNECIRNGHDRYPEDDFMHSCLCQVEVEDMLNMLGITYEYDGDYHIVLSPDTIKRMDITELRENWGK